MYNFKNFFSNLELLEPVSSDDIKVTLIPLVFNYETKLNYISLTEAIKTGNFEITEKSAEGIVQNVLATNNTEDFVLIVEGEELIGAKQNRIINSTILLKPKSKTEIPVSCIEQGRWRFTSWSFIPRERTVNYKLRKKAHETVHQNLKNNRSYHSDQAEIWETINNDINELRIPSPTHSYTDFMDEYYKRFRIDDFINYFDKEFVKKYECNGLAFIINNQIKMIEYFSSKKFFKNFAINLIKGLLVNLPVSSRKVPEIFDNKFEVKKFLNLIMENENKFEMFTPVGVGEEYRFSNSNLKLHLSSLVFDDELIHFVAYND